MTTRRILLHPGFHKTGTSSLQQGAATHLNKLDAHLRLMRTPDILEATRAARRYSARPNASHLGHFAKCFTEAVSSADPTDPRALLISAEDLSGYIPGHHDVPAYDAAPALMNTAVTVLRSHFGPAADVTILYTTRAPASWKRSAWYQNLRAMKLTEDFDDYHPRLTRAAQLDDIVEAVRTRLGGRTQIHSSRIETSGQTPLGPLGVALELLEVSGDGLDPLPAHNLQPEGAADELLALNRSELEGEALANAKREALRRHRKLLSNNGGA